MTHVLDLTEAPPVEEPVRRAAWLSGVMAAVSAELEGELAVTYFEARVLGVFSQAVEAGPYGKKRALRLTREQNRRRGSAIRWGDGLDATSSNYSRE